MIAVTFMGGCGLQLDPPKAPPHTKSEDGALHGVRHESPFLCGTGGTDERGVDCPTTRPPDDRLSCDALGCHGGFDFTDATRNLRHLRGSEGPSCYSCHGDEWSDKKKEE